MYSGPPQVGAHTVTSAEASAGSYGIATISTGTPGAQCIEIEITRSGSLVVLLPTLSLSTTTGVLTVTGVSGTPLLTGDIINWLVA